VRAGICATGLSYRDVEELLADHGVDVDHVSVYRWVQTFTAEYIDGRRVIRVGEAAPEGQDVRVARA
jgi:transposase-like protein